MTENREEAYAKLANPVTISLSLDDRKRLERVRRYLVDSRPDCPTLKVGDVLRWCIKAVEEILVKEQQANV